MTGQAEKPEGSTSRLSQHGGSSEEITTTSQIKTEGLSVQCADQTLKEHDPHTVKVRATDEVIYAHLLPAEAEILKKQVNIPNVKTGWRILYRYATTNDKLIIAVSCICSIAAGAALPLMTVLYGNLAEKFQGFFLGAVSDSSFRQTIADEVLYLIYIGIAEFITIYISTVGFIYTGEHISGEIRTHYLKACLRQNIGFFDNLGPGEVTTRIAADMNLVQDGISEKVALTLNALATFITAFVIGFIKSWKLTLILSASCIAIAVIIGGGSKFIVKYTNQSLQSYALGGTVAEEAISSIRNATAFGTQDKLARQYETHLVKAQKHGYMSKFMFAVMVGAMHMVIYLNYGLAFWMGSRFLVEGDITLSGILTIVMSVMIGAFGLGNVAPNVQAFTTAISAAVKIFTTIDRVSPLDPTSDAGEMLTHIEGTIELKHIKHIYPSRPEVIVMNDVDLIIPAGKKTALVGASGSGKSTIVGLVERFYSPVSGQVLLDNHDISTLNLRWLRQQISLVSQEPILFKTTIFENILHGLIGSRFEHEMGETRKECVIQAAKIANAHDFISALPEGYETNVGEQGLLLSGGQKQRIAIARAMVSNPKILLLDEATSALDAKSEGVVQAALETAATGRTTIIVAHRLSTIRDADNIVVMSEGRIVEQGTHDILLMKQGAYYSLVQAQKIAETLEMSHGAEPHVDEEDDKLAQQLLPDTQYVGFLKNPKDKDPNQNPQGTPRSSVVGQWPRIDGETDYSLWSLIKLIASFNSTEWYWMLLGLFFSIICGGGNPTQEVFAAKQIVSLSTPLVNLVTGKPIPGARSRLRTDVDFWCLMYVMLAFVQLVSFWIQGVAFALCSERLIRRIRMLAFRTILRQDIAFFDKDENTAGALTSFLSTQTTHVAGLSGVTLGTILIVVTTLVAACALSIVIAWKLALVCISTIPILLGCGFFRFWLIAQFQRRAQKAYEKSASYACEATGAIRTVASLTREYDVLKHYENSLKAQARKSLRSILKSSLLYSASQSLIFVCVGLGFW
jgi:ATP-binding cassette, subfamily B (MDR/TAP), member 1